MEGWDQRRATQSDETQTQTQTQAGQGKKETRENMPKTSRLCECEICWPNPRKTRSL